MSSAFGPVVVELDASVVEVAHDGASTLIGTAKPNGLDP